MATDYVLLSSLSIKQFPASRIRIGECEITEAKSLKKFQYLPRHEQSFRMHGFDRHSESTEYTFVKVRAKGRTPNEAQQSALDSFHLLRGIWTLVATHGSWKISLEPSKRKPIGVIHSGPIHTLHNPDGTPAAEYYWYEPDYTNDRELFVPKSENGWDAIEKDRKWAMRKIRKLPYRDDMEDLIIRYAQALDQPNLDDAFLKMWSILEKLTNTVGSRYDETIERATWIYDDRKSAKEILSYLRTRRNRYVHAAKSGENGDQIVYMIKRFVEPHLLRLIRNEFDVTGLREYGDEYLCLPRDPDVLRRRKRQLKVAFDMFGE